MPGQKNFARLQDLESFGIISKAQDPDNRRRVLYQLTEKGTDLAPLLLELVRWSGKYDPDTLASKAILKRIENDRDGFINLKVHCTGESYGSSSTKRYSPEIELSTVCTGTWE